MLTFKTVESVKKINLKTYVLSYKTHLRAIRESRCETQPEAKDNLNTCGNEILDVYLNSEVHINKNCSRDIVSLMNIY